MSNIHTDLNLNTGLFKYFSIALKKSKYFQAGTYVVKICTYLMNAFSLNKKSSVQKRDDRDLIVDYYVLAKVMFAFTLVVGQLFQLNSIWIYIGIYFGIETFLQVFMNIFCKDPNRIPSSYRRATLNGFLNYFEFVFLFAALYQWNECLKFETCISQTPTILEYIYFSFITVSTIGYGDLSIANDIGRILVILQAIIFLLFVLIFLNYNISRIR